MKTSEFLFITLLVLPGISGAQSRGVTPAQPEILIRCDDIGMCHTVNSAFKEVIDTGLPVSASVMFACPWYKEAVEILKAHKNISVGIHLTLNAEWANYRWGPVAGRSAVPSLVDNEGFFFPSRSTLYSNNPKLDEIERELRAQIERAVGTGLRIDYVDYHMSAAVQTLETRAIVEKLAHEFKLGISRYFGEEDVDGWYSSPVGGKKDTLLQRLGKMEPGTLKLFVFHIGLDTPEMGALIDLNPTGLAQMSRHREAELRALTSPEFRSLVKARNIRLKTYSDLTKEPGLERMQRPVQH
jgi:chitin disaccharide deacetylase